MADLDRRSVLIFSASPNSTFSCFRAIKIATQLDSTRNGEASVYHFGASDSPGKNFGVTGRHLAPEDSLLTSLAQLLPLR